MLYGFLFSGLRNHFPALLYVWYPSDWKAPLKPRINSKKTSDALDPRQ